MGTIKHTYLIMRNLEKLPRYPSMKNSFFLLFSSRTLSEFWHWFVANIPGDSVDEGETVFEHLFPLVLPEGHGDHR